MRKLTLATALLLAGCATARPGATLTIAKDWLGPDPFAQYSTCQRVVRDGGTGEGLEKMYTRTDNVSVAGQGKATVTYPVGGDTGDMARATAATEQFRVLNKCMQDAGYRYAAWIDAYEPAHAVCAAKREANPQLDFEACIGEQVPVAQRATLDTKP